MADTDLSISQLPPLTLPVQAGDLLHISRGGDDFRISRTELVRMLLSQLSDATISGTASGQALVYNGVSGKWTNQFVAWATITGRPSYFTPTAHTHLWAEITDAPTELPAATHTHPWFDLTDIPSAFPPESHSHAWGDLTGIPTEFPPEAHGHPWSEVTGKPTAFPPEEHDHSVLYYSKIELGTSGAGGQVHWDNVTDKPETFGTGDMSKSVYDHDDDGIVDEAIHALFADHMPWEGVDDRPEEFPPSAHDHDDHYFTETELITPAGGGSVHWDNITNKPGTFGTGDMSKSVYDQDEDGVVDQALVADYATHVAWENVTERPATFPPDAHTHAGLVADQISATSMIQWPDLNDGDLFAYVPDGDPAELRSLSLLDLKFKMGMYFQYEYAPWSHTHSQYLLDAPSDGTTYGRKNGGWVAATGGGTWGSITGTLSSQTDLQAALNAKVNTASVRELLTTPRTYYVRTNGSDSNNGLSNDAAGAFLTIQKAFDTVVARVDTAGYTVTIQVADGTYSAGLSTTSAWMGGGQIWIVGNTTTPANCVINAGGNMCFYISGNMPAIMGIKGFKLIGSYGL